MSESDVTFVMDEEDRTRIFHGLFWGMVATPIAAVVPLVAIALGVWPAPTPVTATIIHRFLGVAGTGGYLLAAIAQLLYGGLWGIYIAYVSGTTDAPVLARPSTLSIGLGAGFFRAVLASVTGLQLAGWGAFGLLATPKIAFAILVTDLFFGGAAATLIAREEWGRLKVPFAKHAIHHS